MRTFLTVQYRKSAYPQTDPNLKYLFLKKTIRIFHYFLSRFTVINCEAAAFQSGQS